MEYSYFYLDLVYLLMRVMAERCVKDICLFFPYGNLRTFESDIQGHG